MLAACGQYVCYFIDDAVQLDLGKPWLSVLLNIIRVCSLLHVLYGYILFLVIVLFVMYVTGASMKEFRGKNYYLFVTLFAFQSTCIERVVE